jgi:ureidoacrylate peracid hydrolase
MSEHGHGHGHGHGPSKGEGWRLDAAGVGLLVVDVQNGYVHPLGDIGRRGQGAPLQAVVPAVGRLIDLAHAAGIDAYLSRQEHLPDDATRRHRRLPSHHHGEGRSHSPCLRGTWDAELESSVAGRLRPSDYVFTKHRASAFYDTALAAMLRMRAIDLLIVCGVTTNYCVDSSVRDAYARDLEVVLVSDACAALDEDLHEATLRNTAALHGRVATIDEVAAALGRA